MSSRRVVVTGAGFVLPLGTDDEAVLSALSGPNASFRLSEHVSGAAVCPVSGFDLKSFTGRFKNARYLSRGQQLCLAATVKAAAQAGLGSAELDRSGLFLGLGPNLQARPREDKALWLLDCLPNALAAAVAELLGVHGENLTILTACAASTQAIGQAFRTVAAGLADVALAGGGDSRLSLEGTLAYSQAGVLASGFARPDEACRPFDEGRSGFAIGEGGAMFALESLDHARSRGARILAEITGASSSLDGAGMTSPDPEGKAASRAVRQCLATLGTVRPLILAHGTGTVLNDEVEGGIIARTVPNALAVAAFKSRIGHLASACGAAELALGLACALAGRFPAIANLDRPCRADIPLLAAPADLRPEALLLQSFGFGGQNACLGVRPWY